MGVIVRQVGGTVGNGTRTGTDRLTDRACKAAGAGKHSDGKALYLLVKESGSKLWQMKYRIGGREKVYSIGPYPDVPLAEARAERERARAWLRDGKDPTTEKRMDRVRAAAGSDATFSAIAEEFMQAQARKWSRQHAVAVRHRYETDIAPSLGRLPVAEITAPIVLEALRAIERRGALETASKCRVFTAQAFAYAIAAGKATVNPAAGLAKAMPRPAAEHRATIGQEEMPALFEALAHVPAEVNTRLALYFLMLTAARTGEMRFATWGEIDGDGKTWRISAERMKMRSSHVVPLSNQAREVVRQAKALRRTNDSAALLFPGFTRHGALSENALLALLARAGFFGRQTGHGFRSSFSTWAHETHGANADVIEACLAHKLPGIRGVYNRAAYLKERAALLQAWADQLMTWGMKHVSSPAIES